MPVGLQNRPLVFLAAVAIFCSFIWQQNTHAQQGLDPSDIWYRAFLLVTAANADEDSGQYLQALNKLNDAQPLYDQLAEFYPDFQPDIVTQRRNLISQKRNSLKYKMQGRPQVATNSRKLSSGSQNLNTLGGSGVPLAQPMDHMQEGSNEVEILNADSEFALPSWNDGTPLPLNRPTTVIGRPPIPSPGEVAESLLEEEQKKDNLIRILNQENLKLKAEVDTRNRAISDYQYKLSQLEKQRDQLNLQLAEAKGNGSAQERVKKLESLLTQALQQLDELAKTNEGLVEELEESKREMKRLRTQMAMVEKERDSLLEVVKGNRTGGTALKELMDENRKLAARLDRAEKLAASLSELNREKDDDIALLKSEILKVKEQRDQLLADNELHQKSIEALQQKLQMLSDGLTAEERRSLTEVDPVKKQENELLRSMVLKQLRRQAQVKQAKEILLEQLNKVGNRSETLLGIVEDMASGPQLTAEEKALFKSPQFAEIVEAATEVAVTVDASKGESPNTHSETLIAPGDGADPDDLVRNQKIRVELEQLEKAARLDFKEGRLSEAEAGFERYLHFRPRSVSCLCNLGVLQISMKNFTKAQNYLERALAIDDTSGLAYYLLGRVFFMQGKNDEALVKLEEGIHYDPLNAKAHNCVGVISSQKGWVTRAEKAFNEAVSLDPEYGDAHFNLAVLYSTKEEPDPAKAEEHYKRAVNLGIPRDRAIEDYLNGLDSAVGISLGMR